MNTAFFQGFTHKPYPAKLFFELTFLTFHYI